MERSKCHGKIGRKPIKDQLGQMSTIKPILKLSGLKVRFDSFKVSNNIKILRSIFWVGGEKSQEVKIEGILLVKENMYM